MPSLLNLPPNFHTRRLSHGVSDDFYSYATDGLWTTVASNGGGLAASDAAGGVLVFSPSDSTAGDNDEVYLKSTQEVFKFANNKPIQFEAMLQFAEASTNVGNVIVGLKDAVAADSILDTGGGPAASYSGMVFYKVDGDLNWWVESSLAGTQITTRTNLVAGGAAYQLLRIEAVPVSSTVVEIAYLVNGVQCVDANGNKIKHSLTYTNATEMAVCVGLKNGTTTAETLLLDYVQAFQAR